MRRLFENVLELSIVHRSERHGRSEICYRQSSPQRSWRRWIAPPWQREVLVFLPVLHFNRIPGLHGVPGLGRYRPLIHGQQVRQNRNY
jgi:hypothetical protein